MAITFDQLYRAIAGQESGGNYRARGPKTKYGYAWGKYQILESNIGPWSRKYVGRTVSLREYLNSPSIQEKMARGRMLDYWKSYGGNARKVAAAWYGGAGSADLHMSTAKQPGGPSIKAYVDQVLARAGVQPTGSTAGGVDPFSLTGGTPLTNDELAEAYGFNMRLINSSSELKKLFNKAVKEGWGDSEQGKLRFLAALKNTKWWTTQSAELRKYVTLKATDPATFLQNQRAALYKINALAVAVGLGDQIGPGGKTTRVLREAAYYVMAENWSDARIKNWLGGKITMRGDFLSGEAGEAFDAMHELAYANGMNFSESWYLTRARGVVSGTKTMQDIENEIRAGAASTWKAYATQIKAGMNAMDLAAPYIRSLSSLLELPETDVDLFNKHIEGAMRGGADGIGKPLWQFENEVRNDPLWRKTNNARESLMTIAHQVAKDFGFAY